MYSKMGFSLLKFGQQDCGCVQAVLWTAVLTASLRLRNEGRQVRVDCCWKSQAETARRGWTRPPPQGHYGRQSPQVLGSGSKNSVLQWSICNIEKIRLVCTSYKWDVWCIFGHLYFLYLCRMYPCLRVSFRTCSQGLCAPNPTMVCLWRLWKRTLERGNYSVCLGSWTKSSRYE